ncbi:uncharacterized protein LOC130666327 [Microplitis mediator]|uniref:uncharacterized protein LOC130666327 n=1 Tax=Microplitis mediator TaxID=375433 RepID=UPI002554D363|nr:uncharacterized protein LOC130666327 [Microplitis mediator]
MEWIKKFIWCIMIITACSENRIFDKFDSGNSSISWNKMGGLLKLCFSDRTNPIVITNNLIDIIYRSSRDINHPNVNIIDNNYKAKDIQIFNPAYPTYILSAQSTDELGALLDALKSSPTWSVTSVFVIIGITENSCGGASKTLQVLWKLDLVSSYFVCYESAKDEIMMLYTYNPFTNQAPEPWVEVKTFDKPDSRWSLYKQPYLNDKNICRNLTFDKTKFLNGYTVKAATGSRLKSNVTQTKTHNISELKNGLLLNFSCDFFGNLFLHLNVTPDISIISKLNSTNVTLIDLEKLVINSTHDLILVIVPLKYQNSLLDSMNLHYQNGFMIMTQRNKLKLSGEIFHNSLNFDLIAVSVLILFITFVIIICNNGNDYGNGFLDIVRLSLSAGIAAPLHKLSMRIIFLTTTLLVFIITPAFQGHITSMSAKPEYRYPQNLKDLHDFKFHVYYRHTIKNYITEQQLWQGSDKNYLHEHNEFLYTCHEQVLNDSSNACIGYVGVVLPAAKKYNLYLAQEMMFNVYGSYLMRKEWVLKNRIDQLALKFSEHGLFDFWNKREFTYSLKKMKAIEARQRLFEEYDRIEFESLIFVYILMALSLIFWVLIFVAEILIAKRKLLQHRKKIIETLERKIVFVGNRMVLLK